MNGSRIIPTLRYRDAPAAIDWLCRAFGFEEHLVVEGEAGRIAHAQLVHGEAMVMLGSASDDAFGKVQRPLESNDRPVSQSAYLIVNDIEQHYEKAVETGAQIVLELEAQDYGGKGYTCRDPEGNVWNFGSYDPWQES